MFIESINIKSFGRLTDYGVSLSSGMNIFEGDNESGKSTVSEFIKFMLYGMQSKAIGDRELSERKKYINWNTSLASGSMTVNHDGQRILIERTLTAVTDGQGNVAHRESVKMTDTETGSQLHRGKNPGDVIFGVPEEIFTSTAFIRQLSGARVDGGKLSSSAENLLFSADEAVSTEKSIDRIDAVRRQLLYKNGRGGSLYEKERRRDEISAKLESAKRVAGELIAVENSALEMAENKKKAEKNRDVSRKKNENYEAVKKLHMFDQLHEVNDELSALYAEREALLTSELIGDHFPDKSYVGELRAVSDNIASTSSSIASLSRRLDDCKRERGDEADVERRRYLFSDEDAAENVINTATKKHKLGRTLKITAILMLLAVILFIGVWYQNYIPAVKSLGLWGAVVCAVVAAVTLTASVVAAKSAKSYVSSYGAASLEELPIIIEDLCESARRDEELAAEIESLDSELREKYDSYDQALLRAKELILLRGVTAEGDDVPEKLREVPVNCEQICDREEKLSQKTESARAVKDDIIRRLDGADEYEIRKITSELDISEYDSMSPASLKVEVEFNENAVKRLTETIHELEVKRVQLLSMREDPAELAVKLDMLSDEMKAERDRYNACMLAMETLARAGELVRESVVPRIRELAREHLTVITGGKYDRIGVDGEFSMTVDADGAFRELEYMSEGTADAAYLSLRMALVKLLYKKALPPLVFDEAFAHMDDNRASAAMSILSLGDLQSIIFTCHDREGRLAASFPENEYKLHKLS